MGRTDVKESTVYRTENRESNGVVVHTCRKNDRTKMFKTLIYWTPTGKCGRGRLIRRWRLEGIYKMMERSLRNGAGMMGRHGV